MFKTTILKKLVASALMGAFAFSAMAGEAEELLERLQKTYPNIPFSKVSTTEVPGVYEANFGTDLLYTEKTGTYFFPTMFNMKTQRNLGDERRAELSVVDFSSLPLNDAIKIVAGDGSREMAVFADPNCGYCKKLEEQLAKVNNATIYVFPVGILGADSNSKVANVLCSKGDKSKVWLDLMMRGALPAANNCDSKLPEKNLALFKKLGFQGTPAMAFKSGKVLKGYGDIAKIETLLVR